MGDWHLLRCTDCGLVFTSPRYTPDAIATLYSDEYYQNAADYYRSQLSPPSVDDLKLASAAERMLGHKGGRSLDVGCGTGRLVEAFQRAGFQASGIEPNKMVVDAGQQCGRNITTTDLAAVPKNSKDCVTAMHVLEHTYSPKEFLANCHRILDKRGLIIVEAPNYASRASRRSKENWLPLYPDTHLYQFAPDSLAKYFDLTGFKIISSQKMGGTGFLQNAVHQRVDAGEDRDSADVPAARSEKRNFRELIWNSRQIIFRIPCARDIIRYLIWQILGQGEFVRICALKP